MQLVQQNANNKVRIHSLEIGWANAKQTIKISNEIAIKHKKLYIRFDSAFESSE
jgi:hypothetical protein